MPFDTGTDGRSRPSVRDLVMNLHPAVRPLHRGPWLALALLLAFASPGVASAEDIDTAMKLGANHPMGPLELADFIGLDVCLHIMEVLHEGLGDPKYAPCPLLRQYVAAGRLGRKSGRGFYRYDK